MKILTTLSLALLLVPAPAFADEWRAADTYREGAFLAFQVVDYLQTRQIAKKPTLFVENNTILGEHPSVAEVGRYFIVSSLLHFGGAYVLPRGWREAIQYVTIIDKASSVHGNWVIGLHGTW